MNKKVGLISLGCAKNTVDSEIMLGLLENEGYEICSEPEECIVLIVNTCAFIESAREEAINTILEMAQYKENGQCKVLAVTGCLSQRYTSEIQSEMPEVDIILGIAAYGRITDAIEKALNGEKYTDCVYSDDISYLKLPRVTVTPKGSAYIKIAEGCDNRCAYCAIPDIRGPFRSRPIEDIVLEAKRLALSGVVELVVIAQDTTRYGKDIYGSPCLDKLLYKLNEIPVIEWIRVMYMYPDEIAESLIIAMKECTKVVHYCDLPLQHISDTLLKRMNRRGQAQDIKDLFKRFREELSNIVLRTSLIVGFPGETESDFDELMSFVKDTRFDRMGVFCYSKEEGTKAYSMKGQIPKKVKEERYARLMEEQQQISLEINQERIGKVYKTLVEGVAEDGIFYYGRTYAEGPEVDGKVYFTSKEPVEAGSFVDVKILIASHYDLTGEVIS